jgi:hypothetical protein
VIDPRLKLNPEAKAAWLEALRSGRYQQGKNLLVRMNEDGSSEYCCMGVLCELAIDHGVRVVREVAQEGALSVIYFSSHDTFPPHSVKEWAKLDSKAEIELATMNDGQHGDGFNFAKIADWIEENL